MNHFHSFIQAEELGRTIIRHIDRMAAGELLGDQVALPWELPNGMKTTIYIDRPHSLKKMESGILKKVYRDESARAPQEAIARSPGGDLARITPKRL